MPVIKASKAKDRGRYLPPGQRDWPETLIRVVRSRAQDDFFSVQERDVDFALRQAYRNADLHLDEVVHYWVEHENLSLTEAAVQTILRYGNSFFGTPFDDQRAAEQGGIHIIYPHLHNHGELYRWLVLQVAQHLVEAIELAIEDPTLLDVPRDD